MEILSKILDYFSFGFLFLFGDFDPEHIKLLRFPYLIFLFSTSFIGLLCVLLDFAYYRVSGGNSIFKLSYIGFWPTVWMFLFWGVGSGIVGYLSVRLELIAFSIQSSIIVGLGWPLLFPRLYKYASETIENGEAVETQDFETEDEPEEVFDEEGEVEKEENDGD